MSVAVAILLVAGGLLMLLGAVGVVRMPDIYMRMHAATKPVLLGAGCLLAGAALHFGETGLTTRAIFIIFVILLTGPVGAHIIGRAAYFAGSELWTGTVRDDLRGQYDLRTHQLGNVLREPKSLGRPPDPDKTLEQNGSSAERATGHASPKT